MESCEENLSAYEKTPGKQESCDPSFFKTQNCSWAVFVLFPGIENRSEFTSDYSLLPAAVIQLSP